MGRTTKQHKEVNEDGVGKCSKPMWGGAGLPAGFCDNEAYGCQTKKDRQFRELTDQFIYVPHLACPAHGGPKQKSIVKKDGDAWCAHWHDFENLQESVAGFGDTKKEARNNLIEKSA